MNKVLYIILILLFSLTFISCAEVFESSSSSAGSTSRSGTNGNATSSCPGCIVLYIDKKSLSKYKTDDYLLLDPFLGHRRESLDASDFNFLKESGVFPDIIDLTENAPTMAETFTIEMWIWSDQHGDEHQRIIGPSPRISLRGKIANGNAELSYGFNKTGPPKHKNIRINKVGWYHIAMTFDTNGDFIFYLDGEEVSRTDRLRGNKPWDNASGDRDKEWRTRYLGGKWGEGKGNTSGGTFLGKIDDVRMWNVVRTQEQIQETIKSRNQPKTGNEPGYQNLVAYYPMDLNDDNATWELVDLSPRKNNVKIGRYGPLSRANISSGKFTGDFIINEEIRPRFFSDDCPDGPDGSLTCPYPTIRSALDDLHKRIKNGQYGGSVSYTHLTLPTKA